MGIFRYSGESGGSKKPAITVNRNSLKELIDGEIEFAINPAEKMIFDDIKVNEARWVTRFIDGIER